MLTTDSLGNLTVFSLNSACPLAIKHICPGPLQGIAPCGPEPDSYALLLPSGVQLWQLQHQLPFALVRGSHSAAVVAVCCALPLQRAHEDKSAFVDLEVQKKAEQHEQHLQQLQHEQHERGAQQGQRLRWQQGPPPEDPPAQQRCLLASAALDGCIRVWDAYDMSCTRCLDVGRSEATCMAALHEFQTIATGERAFEGDMGWLAACGAVSLRAARAPGFQSNAPAKVAARWRSGAVPG